MGKKGMMRDQQNGWLSYLYFTVPLIEYIIYEPRYNK